METLDALVTYAYDLTLGGGFFYIGTSLTLYLMRRWNELEVKPRAKATFAQTVNIPLQLPAQVREVLPLEAERPALQREAIPLDVLPQQPEASAANRVEEEPEELA